MSSVLFEISSGKIHCHLEWNESKVSPGCEIDDLVSTANDGMEKLAQVYLITVVLIASLNSIQTTIKAETDLRFFRAKFVGEASSWSCSP